MRVARINCPHCGKPIRIRDGRKPEKQEEEETPSIFEQVFGKGKDSIFSQIFGRRGK